jgi:hypothetical protein
VVNKLALRIWLHKWEGDEHGWNAWSLDQLGFATWAPSRNEVLARTPGKLDEYRQWVHRHGGEAPEAGMGEITVVEEIHGNEVAFQADLTAVPPDEIWRCLELLDYSRRDIRSTVEALPDTLLDWDPPYRRFRKDARWRTIRQILEHIALTEAGYYMPHIGYSALEPSELVGAGWQQQLLVSRRETRRFLAGLARSSDRARVRDADEVWSVRKVLRRLVWHELLHWKSIKRVVHDYHSPRA